MYFLIQKKKRIKGIAKIQRRKENHHLSFSRRHSATNQRATRTKYRRERGVPRLPSGSPRNALFSRTESAKAPAKKIHRCYLSRTPPRLASSHRREEKVSLALLRGRRRWLPSRGWPPRSSAFPPPPHPPPRAARRHCRGRAASSSG